MDSFNQADDQIAYHQYCNYHSNDLRASHQTLDDWLATLVSYNANLAEKLAKLGMPGFACLPDRLPDLLAAVLKGQDLNKFAEGARTK